MDKNFLIDLGWRYDHDENNGICYMNGGREKIYIFWDEEEQCYTLEDENEDFGNFYSLEELHGFVKHWADDI